MKTTQMTQSQTIALCVAMLLLPSVVKLGVPTLVHQADQLGWLYPQPKDLYAVTSIHKGVLIVQAPGRSPQPVHLTGLQIDPPWQKEAGGILALVLSSSGSQVRLLHLHSVAEGEMGAIVSLPNGTTLQEVLLRSGLAKLNAEDIRNLPEEMVLRLRQAEAEAKRGRKNVWAEEFSDTYGCMLVVYWSD